MNRAPRPRPLSPPIYDARERWRWTGGKGVEDASLHEEGGGVFKADRGVTLGRPLKLMECQASAGE